jgi:hypothetical protein
MGVDVNSETLLGRPLLALDADSAEELVVLRGANELAALGNPLRVFMFITVHPSIIGYSPSMDENSRSKVFPDGWRRYSLCRVCGLAKREALA